MTKEAFIVGVGEVLWDCFPQREVLGGAPLNATLIADQLGRVTGTRAMMVSRIGNDSRGLRIVETLTKRGAATEYLQHDAEHPTGTVQVELRDGEPHYTIVESVAWDYLEWTPSLPGLAARCAGIIFGTLAQRHATSRATIQRLVAEAPQAVRLLDINLRQQFYTAELLEASCRLASVVKLNHEELDVLQRCLNLAPSEPAQALRQRYDLEALVLTHGEQGTELITSAGSFRAAVPRLEREADADPVGAGDACAATCLLGLVQRWDPQTIVRRANRIAAYVASRVGATPVLPDALLSDL